MSSLTRFAKFRAMPWLLVFEAARLAHSHFMDATTEADRRRAGAVLKRTKGDPRAMNARDREDLTALARKMDLKRLARDLGPTLIRGRPRRRR